MSEYGAERVAAFAEFAEPVPVLSPEAALDYFRGLVPTLGVDPERYGDGVRRKAFTLAAATEETLLEKVQRLLAGVLESGQVTDAEAKVQAVLDGAGVTEANPGYAELVFRTNAADAYNAGAWEEYQSPDVVEEFPAWRYSNPDDTRSRKTHAARNGRVYPSSTSFAEVRGTDIADVAQCRCTFIPLHRSEVDVRRFAESHDDPDQQAEAIADILGGIYGRHALALIDSLEGGESHFADGWQEVDHPRGKGGRFIPKHSAEAKAAAQDALKGELNRPPSPEGLKKLVEHLGILSVSQLHALRREHGLSASGRLKQELVAKLADRLSRGRRASGGDSDGTGPGRGEGGGGPARPPEADRGGLAPQAGGPARPAPDRGGGAGDKSAGQGTTRAVPAPVHRVNERLSRFEGLFRARGQHEAADWMGKLREHVGSVGVEAALAALGPEAAGAKGGPVEYGGAQEIGDFAANYLGRVGVSLIPMGGSAQNPASRVVSSVAPSREGIPSRGKEGDVHAALQTLKSKLEETQHLPGLEQSADLGQLTGGAFGGKVSHFTPEVVKKLDETYGEGGWIVKPYTDEAYGGYGIFFPDRVRQIQQDARSTIWAAGEQVAKYGFSLDRDAAGKVVGLKHGGGDTYPFDSEKYRSTIHGDVRHWGDKAAHMASSEHGVDIDQWSPKAEEGKAGGGTGENFPTARFMASPAFPVVGITNEERAQGVTFKQGQEGRVHIHTRGGKAEIVPHSTWLKKESMPVVFENDDTLAMAQAAVDAINALPEGERRGQLYAPDVIKTAGGYKVVEANPANEAGASGYLADNPFIIDSYVSHVVGREPAHVQFVRKLLSTRKATPPPA